MKTNETQTGPANFPSTRSRHKYFGDGELKGRQLEACPIIDAVPLSLDALASSLLAIWVRRLLSEVLGLRIGSGAGPTRSVCSGVAHTSLSLLVFAPLN